MDLTGDGYEYGGKAGENGMTNDFGDTSSMNLNGNGRQKHQITIRIEEEKPRRILSSFLFCWLGWLARCSNRDYEYEYKYGLLGSSGG